ncbi:unnamed protein product [Allacma fusca]|uniref:Uncharacterized protein n=1 Tax=Allacma fusca TaxID=39272 RepID=A0A8J2LUK3_9HEXA|nr:unnamed protein product [Allacma fusca]
MGTISNTGGSQTEKTSKNEPGKSRKSSKKEKTEKDQCKEYQDLWQRIYGPCRPLILNSVSKQASEQGSTTDSKESQNKGQKSAKQGQSHGKGTAGSQRPPTSSRNRPGDDKTRSQAKPGDLPNGWECAGYYVFPTGGNAPMFKYSSGDQRPTAVCPQYCLPQGYVDLFRNNQGDSSEESSSDTSESDDQNGKDKKGGVKNQATGTGVKGSADKKELGKTARKSTATKDPGKNDQKTTEKKELKKTDEESSKENVTGGNESQLALQAYPPAPPSSHSSETSSSSPGSGISGHSSAPNNNFQGMYQQQTPPTGNMMHACMGTYPQSTQAMQAIPVQLPPHWPPKPGPEFSSSPKDDEGLNFKFKPRPDFATEVTFTIEPKKTPMWQKMMRCGFRPMITCSAPPFNLPSNYDQAKKKCLGGKSSEESSSGDSTSGSDSSGSSDSSASSGSDSDDSDIPHDTTSEGFGFGSSYLSDSSTVASFNSSSTTVDLAQVQTG